MLEGVSIPVGECEVDCCQLASAVRTKAGEELTPDQWAQFIATIVTFLLQLFGGGGAAAARPPASGPEQPEPDGQQPERTRPSVSPTEAPKAGRHIVPGRR